MTKGLENKIANMEPKMMKSILHMRERYASLMELSHEKILELQGKAVLLNYLSGEGRRLDSGSHHYKVPDGKGGYKDKETFFVYNSSYRI